MMRSLAFCLGLSMVGLTLGAEAQANPAPDAPPPFAEEPPPSELRVVAPELPVPRNGSILIKETFGGVGVTLGPPIVQVAKIDGATTTTFTGTVRQVFPGYWSWTPAEPLELGQYLVSLAHPSVGSSSATITIVAEVVLEPPVLGSQAVAVVTIYPSRYEHCQHWTGTALVDVPFVSRLAGQVSVSANLTFSSEVPTAHQYLYRAFMNASDPTLFVSSDSPIIVGPYTEEAEGYCFGVEALDIATSTVHSYPDVTFCVVHGSLESLAEREAGLLDEDVYRTSCTIPPSGYEELWCESNADCIEIWRTPENVDSNACQTYFDMCPDAMRPDAGASGAGGSGGTGEGGEGGADPDAGVVDPGAAGAGDEGHDDIGGSSGCSITRASSAPQLSALSPAMLIALAALRARRRRYLAPASGSTPSA